MALVLTLSLIVVATVIVTAFFFRSRFDAQGSAGYSSQVTAAKLAELGSAQVVTALLAEAEEGAASVLGNGADRVFIVDNPANMVVKREISSALAGGDFGPLVKQSLPALAGGSAAIAAGIRISNVPTYESSKADKPGYRPLGGEFWDRPMLTRDSFSDSDVPNWVYVNARGETVTAAPGRNPAPEDRIVGRYAFNVYDVGGLLDMNVAGATPGTIPEIEGRKGNLVLADLEWLSQQAGAPLDIGRLNEWRYRPDVQWAASNGKPSESLAAVLRSGPMFASLGKFPPGMDTIHGTTLERPNKNAFLSRSDLLNYLRAELGSEASARLLAPYLTHFTRDINAPTYRWDWGKGRPTTVLYRNDSAGAEDVINSEIWTDDGQSLMPRRFPLDQIDLLKLNTSGSPVANRSDEVQKQFGLTWNSSLKRWVYDQDKIVLNSNNLPRFRTLEEVKKANDTPNFFEVLQAAINVGSLGHQLAGVPPVINPLAAPPRHTDQGFIDPEFSSTPNNRPHAIGLDDSCVAYHVARIGAAVMDQWDEDSLPTELEVNGTVIFGVEDLPYLHGFKRANYYGQGPDIRITDGGGAFNVREGRTYLHPQVWNPHARPVNPPTVARPTTFRVVPYTTTLPRQNSGVGRIGGNPPTTEPNVAYGTDFGRPNIWPNDATYGGQHQSANGSVDYTDRVISDRYGGAASLGNLDGYHPGGPNPLLREDDDYIEFDYSESLREPALLWTPSGNGVAGDIDARPSGSGTTDGQFQIDRIKNIAVVHPSDTKPRIGFRLGRYYVNSATNGDYTGAPWSQIDLLRFRGWAEYYTKVNFALQYKIPGSGEWKTYDIMYDAVDVFTPANTMSQLGAGQDQVWRVMGRDGDATFRVDPRVERFGPQTQFYRVWSGTETLLNPSNTTNLAYFPPNSTGFTADSATPTSASTTSPRNLKTGSFLFRTWDGGSTDNRFIASNHYPRPNGSTSGSLARIRNLRQQWLPYTSWASTQGFLNPKNVFFNEIAGNSPSQGSDFVRYLDPDDQARRGSAGWLSSFFDNNRNPMTRNSNPGNPVNADARPVVLNRPFQSVAEMGYACRDLPWKSVDFWNANTGDNALLDYFCINSVDNDPTVDPEASQLMAGVLNLNSADPLVLEAVLRGASGRADGDVATDSMRLTDANYKDIATAISNWVDPNNSDPAEGPFRSRAEVAGKLVAGKTFSSPVSGRFTDGVQSDTNNSSAIRNAIGNNLYFDSRRTSLMRALVDSVGVRTWNLMIDVTAQSGGLPQGSTQLSEFNVDGQARYWVFVAIDRVTGKVIDQRIETVH